MPGWKVQALYDILLARAVMNKASVVYVESAEGLVGEYGAPFADFLSGFTKVTE